MQLFMRLYDISVAITPGETPTYPGDPGVEVEAWASILKGDPANVSVVRFGAHTATHLDAPAHFIEGAPGLPSLRLESLIGDATVVEIPDDVLAIDETHVASLVPATAARVLFKTRNSAFWREPGGHFRRDFTFLTPAAARSLAGRGVRLVGIDYLSIEEFGSKDFAAHVALLTAGVVILEGLDLGAVAPGRYELLCLPLKLAAGSGDGAPARAVLRALD
ncbi:MAG TPA: cyclase family protein [Pyrinomonadaceae bacterium]|nr:cyclase family protein [Pyrinomonadaceae bacterium]